MPDADTTSNEATEKGPPVASVTAKVGSRRKKVPAAAKAAPTAKAATAETESSDRGLSPIQLARFHVHIDKTKHCEFKDLLAQRPNVYRPFQRKHTNRFQCLKALRNSNNKKDALDYFKLLKNAVELVAQQGDDEEALTSSKGASKTDAEEESQAEIPPPAPKKQKVSASVVKEKTTAPSVAKTPPRMTDQDSVGASTITTRASMFGSPQGKGGMGKNVIRFKNIDEAVEFADQVM